jgi:benzoate/toluate 1,2-dioxygenase subunit alpha
MAEPMTSNDASPGELVQITDKAFRVHTRAYADADIFRLEMTRIFGRTWVFVGHVSEIPDAGDYKTSYIGTQPVIVTRGKEGGIHVLVNRCVHRGAVVAREASGRADHFTCPYHGWVYGIDGRLQGIGLRRDGGYPDDYEAPQGLFTVPRVETYRGLIFASFNAAIGSLDSHLGAAKLAIDRKFNRSPQGEIELRSRPFVGRYRGNWKFQAENIVDGYHFLFVHAGFAKLQGRYGDSTGDFGVHKGGSVDEMRKIRGRGFAYGCRQGHGMLLTPAPSHMSLLEGEFGPYFRELRDQHGDDEFQWIAGSAAASIFPNLGLIHHQLRTWRPVSVDETEVTVYPFSLKGAPDAYNEGWLHSEERFYGPAGYGQADDVEIFAVNQQGLQGDAQPWLVLDRALYNEERVDQDDRRGNHYGETPQRAIWRGWKTLMSQP